MSVDVSGDGERESVRKRMRRIDLGGGSTFLPWPKTSQSQMHGVGCET